MTSAICWGSPLMLSKINDNPYGIPNPWCVKKVWQSLLTSVTGVQLLEVGDDEHGAVLLLADGPDGVPDQRAVHEAVLVVAQEGVDQVAPTVQHDEFHGPLTGEPPEDPHQALELLRRGGSHCALDQ